MTGGKQILLVEDDAAIAMIVREALTGECDNISVVGTLAERDLWLCQNKADLIITDVVLPDGDGLDSLTRADLDSRLPVIVLSAQNTLDTAVRAADMGSYDYLPKPFDLAELTASVRAALRRSGMAEPTADLSAGGGDSGTLNYGLVGRSPPMQAVFRTIARLASNDLAVLILGESGTGKEIVAQAIHATGLRRSGPFVAINMAAIPRELIEAELFGHEKGAFTGAHSRNAGRFEQAAGGTLFLDEIGDMPLEAQTRLLRVLQSNEYSTVGGSRSLKADVRIVAATHRDVPALIQQGLFREDLYYRLNVIPIQLPALRDRRTDIAALIEHFVETGRAAGLPVRRFSSEALRKLERHDWPGNVRELGNMVHRLAVLARDAMVSADDIDLMASAGPACLESVEMQDDLDQALAHWVRTQLAQPGMDGSLHQALLARVETVLISKVMAAAKGNQLETARRLGINRNTLRKRLEQLRIAVTRQ